MNLNSRITRLERTLASQRCSCPDNADLSWPGHQPLQQCANRGGERLIFTLNHDPGGAERLVRAALPLLAKTYNGSDRLDYSKLTDKELDQVSTALRATHPHGR
jgi:hypothetical protein